MKRLYIDFDGVILDTEDLLFEDWRKIPNHKNLSEEEKRDVRKGYYEPDEFDYDDDDDHDY